MDEGKIKFDLRKVSKPVKEFPEYRMLNEWRNRLYDLNLIGVYDNGIGFGNLSSREENTEKFYISGSGTGHLERLSLEHYARVTGYDFTKNRLVCVGQIAASLESLSHAAVYANERMAKAVIHVHNLQMWEHLIGKVPTTSEKVEFFDNLYNKTYKIANML